ncbi:hypothetical protein [Lactococcus lactis]|uniref:hypothetical protein n=1 Tax=Lactococcus lactis TaxID=1358 RepID=UPI000BF24D9D|nr:hypothetical protein [Lactococcus lactis]
MKVVNCTKCNEEYAIDLNKPEEWYCPYCDNLYSITTDKLSVEKLQEHLLPYSKEMVQKIKDEKMQLVTADEFVKLHKESLTAIRENDKLQEQLNTAKKALTEITNIPESDNYFDEEERLSCIKEAAEKALAAIGGNDESLDN